MYIQMLTLAEGSLSEGDFAAWMRPRLRSKAQNKVHEPKRRYG
jgi:death-on-curing protein